MADFKRSGYVEIQAASLKSSSAGNRILWNLCWFLSNVFFPFRVKDKTDLDVLRENHRFLWRDEDEEDMTWWSSRVRRWTRSCRCPRLNRCLFSPREKELAKKYYDKLFKEYCIADLSRYKENKVKKNKEPRGFWPPLLHFILQKDHSFLVRRRSLKATLCRTEVIWTLADFQIYVYLGDLQMLRTDLVKHLFIKGIK